MFKKILVANRGEVALRVIRACREMGIRSVSVHSEVDRDALHTRFADESLCIGPPPAAQSYLHMPALVSAAEVTGCDAVHPGWGFLAENPEFAEVTAKCGMKFIGPQPEMIRLMGDKVQARRRMSEAGLSILDGSDVVGTDAEAASVASKVGYPVLIKALAGGGGRGMKVVERPERLTASWAAARSEAQAAFGNPDVYIERYLPRARHIEVQVLADTHGNVLHLYERECSVQRKHQKLVEESPSPALSQKRREKLCRGVVDAVERIGYDNIGTVELLYDPERDHFFFMEMNTRLQVEHTVTEMVTGIDLVVEQIRIAAGEKISVRQEEIQLRGCAIEVRINAEDPLTFSPSPGKITALNKPGGPGVRIDSHVYAQYVVPPHYDSLLAKLIVHADDRPAALRRLGRALHEFVIEGISTNLPLYKRLLEYPDFVAGNLDTRLVERLHSA